MGIDEWKGKLPKIERETNKMVSQKRKNNSNLNGVDKEY
jgi:hypothetical protein